MTKTPDQSMSQRKMNAVSTTGMATSTISNDRIHVKQHPRIREIINNFHKGYMEDKMPLNQNQSIIQINLNYLGKNVKARTIFNNVSKTTKSKKTR